MINISTKLKGDLTSALDRLASASAESALRSAGYAGAKVFQDEAKARVPVDTGILQDNIIVKRAEEKSKGAMSQTYIVTVRKGKKGGPDAFYWRFVEFGTSKMSARPFMRPAFDSKSKEAVDAMKQKLSEKVAELLGAK
jgi:HK97 gp10 family phage protein